MFPPHITVCYLEELSFNDIISKLQNTKKFNIRFTKLNNEKKYTYYVPNNLKNIHNILKIFIKNIYAVPKKGFHMSLMYNGNKDNIKTLKNYLPLSIPVTKLYIMKETDNEWKKVKTIFLND